MKKLKGFILIITSENLDKEQDKFYEVEHCVDKEELDGRWHINWDDKWDCKHRDKFHFYSIDLKTMKIKELKKWKSKFNYKKWKKTEEAGE